MNLTLTLTKAQRDQIIGHALPKLLEAMQQTLYVGREFIAGDEMRLDYKLTIDRVDAATGTIEFTSP